METKNTSNEKLNTNLKNISHILFVLSGKGGVGKSTLATNIAIYLANKKNKVGLLDIDIHGPSIPKLLGIENAKLTITENEIHSVTVTPYLHVMSMAFLLQNQDHPVIWRGPMKMGAIQQFLRDVNWGKLDYLIIDLPPGTGDEPLSIAQLIPKADGAIIVTTPQDVALLSVRKSISFVQKMGLPVIGIIENMSGFKCPHCGKAINLFKTGGAQQAAKDFNVPFLGKIPLEPAIAESGDAGTTTTLLKTNSTINTAITKIITNIESQLKNNKK